MVTAVLSGETSKSFATVLVSSTTTPACEKVEFKEASLAIPPPCYPHETPSVPEAEEHQNT